MVDVFAASGYLAIAPSTFNRGRYSIDFGYAHDHADWGLRISRPLKPLPSPLIMLDIAAAVFYGQRHTTGAQVGLAGFCWGGMLAWRAVAILPDIQAVACHGGGGMTSREEVALQPLCPVMAHFSLDRAWTDMNAIQEFVQAHSSPPSTADDPVKNAAVVVHQYAGSRYGFFLPRRGEQPPVEAQIARNRTLAFMAQHLLK